MYPDNRPVSGLIAVKMQVNVANLWITLSSVILAFSFTFSSSVRTVWENVVYLFVVHPYASPPTLL